MLNTPNTLVTKDTSMLIIQIIHLYARLPHHDFCIQDLYKPWFTNIPKHIQEPSYYCMVKISSLANQKYNMWNGVQPHLTPEHSNKVLLPLQQSFASKLLLFLNFHHKMWIPTLFMGTAKVSNSIFVPDFHDKCKPCTQQFLNRYKIYVTS